MQALKTACAVFCTSCICAEVLTRFAGSGWAKRCIKAAAGLYILVAALHAVPQAVSALPAWQPPQRSSVPSAAQEEAVLRRAEQTLEQSLRARCSAELGIEIELEITLGQTETGVEAACVQAVIPQGLSIRKQQELRVFLKEQLGTEPVLKTKESPA